MSLRSHLLWPAGLALSPAPLLIVANIGYNHFNPPLGLLYSPVVAALACTLGLAGAAAWHPHARAGLCAGLLMAQDLGMKLYGGSIDDQGWQATCSLLLLLAALLSLGVLAVGLGRSQPPPARHRLAAAGLFVALLAGHLLLCASLGLGHAIGFYLD